MAESMVKAERPGGFLDFLPADYLAREKMLKTIERVFRSFGFDPIETPRLEFLRTLAGETSDTGKNIFRLHSAHDTEPLALAFDHTVPLARILAANPYDAKKRTGIRLPWRRMTVGPVFRADNPQNGRYRQFYQFDADIAGSSSMLADAEIMAMMCRTMEELGIGRYLILLNNRKILNGLGQLAGITERGEVTAEEIIREMMRILDKLDKIGMERVLLELAAPPTDQGQPAPHLGPGEIEKIKAFLVLEGDNREKLRQGRVLFQEIPVALEGIEELEQILNFLEVMAIDPARMQVDFSIARGLDYYTGPVMEMILQDAPEFGSIFSGGRYNGLVSRFTGRELPAVGASIGVDRLFAALDHLGLIDRSQQTVSKVLVMRIAKERDADYLKIMTLLRQNGINAELCLLDDTTFKGQFNFAISRGVQFILICGEDEFLKQTVQVKNLATRAQEEMPLAALADFFRSA